MKVLEINVNSGKGSTGKIATDIATDLNDRGIECVVAYGRGYRDVGVKTYKIGNKIDYYCHALSARIFDNVGFGSKRATREFIKWIKEYDPDVIHLHNIHGYYINIQILFDYLSKANKPVIWTLHDCWAFTGHCAYFDMAKCDKWKAGCKGICPCKKDYPASYLFSDSEHNWKSKRKIINSVKNIVFVSPSEWLANLLKESFLNKYPVLVINNGIDTNVFKPQNSNFRQRYDLENKKIILGVASVWDKRKGFDDFLKLSSMIDRNSKIILVGLSKQQIELLPPNILGIERTESVEELVEIYSAADVFLNLTYEDNYPTVNLEAQACGTPVITYKTGGSIESVSQKNIVDLGDLERIVDLIYNMKSSTEKIIDSKDSVNKYVSVYEKVIREGYVK